MAWNKVTADELKEAGLDVEAFKASMTKQTEMDNTIKEIKASVDGLSAVKDTLAALENKLKEFKPPATAGAAGGGAAGGSGSSGGSGGAGGASGGSNEPELDWIMEPEKATTATIHKTMAPLLATTANMQASLNWSNFAGRGLKGFRKYETEIKELWDKQSLAAKQNPEVLENCYKIIMANHIDEIQKGGETFFVESTGGAGNTPPGSSTTGKKAVDVLNKDQLDLCAKWGVDPEDYLKELQAGGATQYA